MRLYFYLPIALMLGLTACDGGNVNRRPAPMVRSPLSSIICIMSPTEHTALQELSGHHQFTIAKAPS